MDNAKRPAPTATELRSALRAFNDYCLAHLGDLPTPDLTTADLIHYWAANFAESESCPAMKQTEEQ